jgi:cell division protein FtsB
LFNFSFLGSKIKGFGFSGKIINAVINFCLAKKKVMQMKKIGRPKSINVAKNRVHSIILTPAAERVYRHICNKHDSKAWLNTFISEQLCLVYMRDPNFVLKQEILDLQAQRDALEAKMRLLADKVRRNKQEMLMEQAKNTKLVN